MRKLFILSFSVLFSIGLYAQQTVYSDSDAKLKYDVTVEKLTDEVNDEFYEYYSIEIKNVSNSEVTFTPLFNYKTKEGDLRSSLSHDENENEIVTLVPGQTIKGSISKNHKSEYRNLTIVVKKHLTMFMF